MITEKDRKAIKRMQKYWKWIIPLFIFLICLLLIGAGVHIYVMRLTAQAFETSVNEVLELDWSPASPFRTYEGYEVIIFNSLLHAVIYIGVAVWMAVHLLDAWGTRRLILRLWHRIEELERTLAQASY
ncbi:MAG: hypothetical protein AMS15_07175 [Planctomycetes bacterium DG_23]|nr:MAG: hypothetical protein AMS15_07175 [Planctomycetes bacterium DG_23]